MISSIDIAQIPNSHWIAFALILLVVMKIVIPKRRKRLGRRMDAIDKKSTRNNNKIEKKRQKSKG